MAGTEAEHTLYGGHGNQVGFEVLTAVSTKMSLFWVVAPCSLVDEFTVTRCLKLDREARKLHVSFLTAPFLLHRPYRVEL
jgi:hypothetical protein